MILFDDPAFPLLDVYTIVVLFRFATFSVVFYVFTGNYLLSFPICKMLSETFSIFYRCVFLQDRSILVLFPISYLVCNGYNHDITYIHPIDRYRLCCVFFYHEKKIRNDVFPLLGMSLSVNILSLFSVYSTHMVYSLILPCFCFWNNLSYTFVSIVISTLAFPLSYQPYSNTILFTYVYESSSRYHSSTMASKKNLHCILVRLSRS